MLPVNFKLAEEVFVRRTTAQREVLIVPASLSPVGFADSFDSVIIMYRVVRKRAGISLTRTRRAQSGARYRWFTGTYRYKVCLAETEDLYPHYLRRIGWE